MRALLADPNTLLVLIGGLIFFAETAALVLHRPAVGLALILAAVTSRAVGLDQLALIGTVRVTSLDVTAAVLAAASALHLLRRRKRIPLPVLLLVGLTGLALIRGIAAYGVQQAVNSTRDLSYFIVVLIFSTVFGDRLPWRSVERAWITAACVYVVLGAAFLLTHGLGSYATDGSRALNSQQALVVAQASVILLIGSKGRRRWLAALFLVFVLVSQQRTVWAAAITTVVVLAVKSTAFAKTSDSRRVRRLVGLGALLVASLVAIGPSSLRQSFDQAGEISASEGTFGWRVTSGVELVQATARKPLEDLSLGQPSGAGFARVINGQIWTVTPHNNYLMVLVSLGVVGLVALLVFLGAAVRRSSGQPLVLALVVGLLIYSMGYQLSPEQAIIVAAAFVRTVPSVPAGSTRKEVGHDRLSLADVP